MATYDAVAYFPVESPVEVSAVATLAPFVAANFTENFSASVSSRLSLPVVRANFTELFSATPVLIWTRGVQADLREVFTASITAFTRTQDVSGITGTMTSSMTARISTPRKELFMGDIVRAVYALWGFDGIKDIGSINIGRQRIVEWVNKALQEIYSRADKLEYFNRERITVDVTSSGSVELPGTVQRIHGEAQINERPLLTMTSRAQVQGFSRIHPGATAPLAFYVESTRSPGADSLVMTLYVSPAPSDTASVSLDVTLHPPRYDESDLLGGAVVPLPHLFAESILMPMVRKWALGDSLMPTSRRAAQTKEIDEGYARALEQLGMADSSPTVEREAKKNP